MSDTSSETVTVLDHIDKIVVPGNVFHEPANEYWALICLWSGMEFLNKQVASCQEVVRQRVNPEGKLRIQRGGNSPGFEGIPKPLIVCSFHWYAVSACNYVRTVGAIAYRQDTTRPKPPEYVKNVIPEVLPFRDKIAAHFSWSTKH